MTGEERRELARRIDQARRAGLRPARFDARPGFIASTLAVVANTGREIVRPTLQWYDDLPPSKPQILRHLNG